FQIPPLAVPIKRVLASVGWAAMASTAPDTGLPCASIPATLGLFWMGPGPCSTQLGTPVNVIAGTVRSSRISTASRRTERRERGTAARKLLSVRSLPRAILRSQDANVTRESPSFEYWP